MQKITKAVIPCGGCGTRFLPITKAVAKEMLPIVDKPCLDYIVDELIESGVTDVMIIVSPDKQEIVDYYTPAKRLNARLEQDGKQKELALLTALENKVRVHFVEQTEPLGSGHAIALAEEFCAGEPFVLALGDDLMRAPVPVAKQLIAVYEKYGKTVLGVQRRALPEILRYGVIDVKSDLGGGTYDMNGILEKPSADELTSDLATLGRYVVAPAVFDALRRIKPAANGELQFTDALDLLAREQGAVAHVFDGKRYDLGQKLGSLQAIVEIALEHEEVGAEFAAYLNGRKER